jgi:ribosomal protein S18 acetylase RimI-like enzyme
MKIGIRKAGTCDVAALVKLNGQVQSLHAALYPGDFKPKVDDDELADFMISVMEQDENRILIAEIDEIAVGYVWLEIKNCPETALTFARRVVFLQQICVNSGHRRRGIGSALLIQIEQFAKEDGADEILLGTWSSNEIAQGFFRSRGFEPFTILMRKHPPSAS